MRYNEYRAAQINGSAAPGYSSDQATAALEDVFKQTMPSEMGFDYMGMSYQEQKAREGLPASVIFGFSLVFVFLVLAALYESWSLPFSVLLGTSGAVTTSSRSEEHTSELQSHLNLVCRLLLEKKKTIISIFTAYTDTV